MRRCWRGRAADSVTSGARPTISCRAHDAATSRRVKSGDVLKLTGRAERRARCRTSEPAARVRRVLTADGEIETHIGTLPRSGSCRPDQQTRIEQASDLVSRLPDSADLGGAASRPPNWVDRSHGNAVAKAAQQQGSHSLRTTQQSISPRGHQHLQSLDYFVDRRR
jgi:hypothetical protein